MSMDGYRDVCTCEPQDREHWRVRYIVPFVKSSLRGYAILCCNKCKAVWQVDSAYVDFLPHPDPEGQPPNEIAAPPELVKPKRKAGRPRKGQEKNPQWYDKIDEEED